MSYRSRDQKRDKLSRCRTCKFFKVPPGTNDTICPDCRFNEVMHKAIKKLGDNGQNSI